MGSVVIPKKHGACLSVVESSDGNANWKRQCQWRTWGKYCFIIIITCLIWAHGGPLNLSQNYDLLFFHFFFLLLTRNCLAEATHPALNISQRPDAATSMARLPTIIPMTTRLFHCFAVLICFLRAFTAWQLLFSGVDFWVKHYPHPAPPLPRPPPPPR